MPEEERIPAYLIQFAVADPRVNTSTVACLRKPIAADGIRQDETRAILERTRSFPIASIKIQAGLDFIHVLSKPRRLSHGVCKQYRNGFDRNVDVLQIAEWARDELIRGGQAKPRRKILEPRLPSSDEEPRGEAIDEHTGIAENAILVETVDDIYTSRR
jgi:hypothetical protein